MFQTQLSIRLGFTAKELEGRAKQSYLQEAGLQLVDQTHLDMLKKVGDVTTGNATHLSIFWTFQLFVQSLNFKPAF